VQAGQGGDRVEAKVAAVGPGIDLAVLTVEQAETLAFRRKALLEATEPLMSQNGIPSRGSDDILPICSAKPIAAH